MTYGIDLNVSLAINDDYTSIGIKANDTEGLDIDYYEEGKDSEAVVQNAIQEFFVDYLASCKKKEEPKPEPKKIKNDDLFSALDHLFENDDEEIDNLFDDFDRSFFGESKWTKSTKDILNGNEKEDSYGGFNSWEEERQSLLDDLNDLAIETENQRQDYNNLRIKYSDLLAEVDEIRDRMRDLASLF